MPLQLVAAKQDPGVRRTDGSRHVGGLRRGPQRPVELFPRHALRSSWRICLTNSRRCSTGSTREADSAALATDVRAYANGLLTALRSDEAIIPELQADTPRVLALVLTHHIRNPSHGAGWLNLGLALRRLAAWDCPSSRAQRLERAISCFDRSLALSADERAVNVRAWVGKALAFMQLGDLNEAVRCSAAALELDRSDPESVASSLGLCGQGRQRG